MGAFADAIGGAIRTLGTGGCLRTKVESHTAELFILNQKSLCGTLAIIGTCGIPYVL